MIKKCSKCKQIKQKTEFSPCNWIKPGRWCKKCNALKLQTWRLKNPKKQKDYRNKYYYEDINLSRQYNREKYKKYSKNSDYVEKCNHAAQKYRDSKFNNTEYKEKQYKYHAKWRHENRGKCRFLAILRQKRIKNATPKWLTKEHLLEILALYEQASRMSETSIEPFHVDHIVPIKGKNICGLHVPWNLQIITKTQNLKKKNKF